METKQEKAAPKERSKGKKIRMIIIPIVVILVIVFGINTWIEHSRYETTDNAQFDADVIPVRSSVSGYVKTVDFKENQLVKKGSLLVTIDDVELKAKMLAAQAALENAKANLSAIKNNSNAADMNADAAALTSDALKQNIDAASAKLKKVEEDFKRVESMLKDNAATKMQFDAVKAELDVAKAQYEFSVSQYKSSTAQSGGSHSQAEAQKSQIALAEALVKQREAELVLAQTQLDNATIEAPFDGIISKKAVEPGQYIQTGQPTCSAISSENLWVTANFKETQLRYIRTGQEVEIKIDAYPDLEITGKVESIGGATGARFSLLPPDNSTGNFVKVTQRVPVRIVVNKAECKNGEVLVPGLSVFVKVKVN